jgi:uncharacterized protein YdhG (YjbR/CyaY superfamily)
VKTLVKADSTAPRAAIDAYVAALSEPVRERFAALCAVVREAAPDAAERMTYGMPTWHQGENLVHLAAFARHIGIYPGPRAIEEFAAELAEFKTSKGAVQVQHEQALPLALLRRIVERRVEQAVARPAKRR